MVSERGGVLKGFIRGIARMKLDGVVKYANVVYAGLMIGLAAYIAILIKHGYTFVPVSPQNVTSVSQLFASGALGPLALGLIPWVLMVMIIATVFIVLLNMVYENSLKPVSREVKRKREEPKSKGKNKNK